MSLNKVVLLACGSFNPPTNMHLRMFELAKDHLHRLGNHLVVGGFISPVHDSYGKTDLVAAKHRLAMLRLSLDDNSWIKVSDWETRQETWTRTRQSLNYHQNAINSKLTLNGFDPNSNDNEQLNFGTLLPDNYRNNLDVGGPTQVKLLCGADLLESFGTPGLWATEDIEAIVGQYGLVVITRENSNPLKFIYNSDVLTKYMGNIIIVTEWITNEVSSTKIRRALRRSESVKYLIPDKVIDYIQDNALFGTNNKTKYLMPTSIINNHNLLTPSPSGASDMSIDTPSPISCMNLCNNNLFTGAPTVLSIDVPDASKFITKSAAVAASGAAKTNGGSVKDVKHPGQAVKIVMESNGAHTHKVVKEVRTPTPSAASTALKNSKSCTELAHLTKDPPCGGGGSKAADKTTSRSNDDLLDRKSCDENLIRFIFTKHGIQMQPIHPDYQKLKINLEALLERPACLL